MWVTCGSASFVCYFSWLSVTGSCFQWNAGCCVWRSIVALADSFLQRGFNILLEGRLPYGQITWITWGTRIPIFSLPRMVRQLKYLLSVVAANQLVLACFSASRFAHLQLRNGQCPGRSTAQQTGLPPQSTCPGPSHADCMAVLHSGLLLAFYQLWAAAICWYVHLTFRSDTCPQGKREAMTVSPPSCISLLPGVLALRPWLPLWLFIALKQLEFFVCSLFLVSFYFSCCQQENWV